MSALLLVVVAAASVLHVTDDFVDGELRGRRSGDKHLERDTAGYVGGGRTIPVEVVERLREVLAHSDHGVDPATLGITPDTVEVHRAQIAASAHLTAAQAAQLDVARVLHIVETNLAHAPMSDHPNQVEVDIHLDDGQELAVSSRHDTAMMVPWRVTIHGRTWDSFDPAIDAAVDALLPQDSPNRALLRDTSYWRTELWKDRDWSFWIRRADARDRDLDAARNLRGFDDAMRAWSIEDAVDEGSGLTITLTPRATGLVTWVRWAVDASLPSFAEATKRIALAERRLRESWWFTRWREAGMTRVGLMIGAMERRGFVETVWRDAALRSKPDATLIITNETTNMSAVLFAAPGDERVIVWEGLNVPGIPGMFSTRMGQGYVIAQPSGTFTQRPFPQGPVLFEQTPP